MINLHESMGLGLYQIRDPWICSQMHICSQTRYQLPYAPPWNQLERETTRRGDNKYRYILCRITKLLEKKFFSNEELLVLEKHMLEALECARMAKDKQQVVP